MVSWGLDAPLTRVNAPTGRFFSAQSRHSARISASISAIIPFSDQKAQICPARAASLGGGGTGRRAQRRVVYMSVDKM
jgi:hypothetical protein